MGKQAFRSMRPRELLRLLEGLGYVTTAQRGHIGSLRRRIVRA
jgi:predicted RNA binding protein YcfA (HicA-like mRNA interferase family)